MFQKRDGVCETVARQIEIAQICARFDHSGIKLNGVPVIFFRTFGISQFAQGKPEIVEQDRVPPSAVESFAIAFNSGLVSPGTAMQVA